MNASIIYSLMSLASGLMPQMQKPELGEGIDFATLLAARLNGTEGGKPTEAQGKANALLNFLFQKNQLVGNPLDIDLGQLQSQQAEDVKELLEQLFDKLQDLSPEMAELLGAMIAQQNNADPQLSVELENKVAEAINSIAGDTEALQDMLDKIGELERLADNLSTLVGSGNDALTSGAGESFAPPGVIQGIAMAVLGAFAELAEPIRDAAESILGEMPAFTPNESAGSFLKTLRQVLSQLRESFAQAMGRDRADAPLSSVMSQVADSSRQGEVSPSVSAARFAQMASSSALVTPTDVSAITADASLSETGVLLPPGFMVSARMDLAFQAQGNPEQLDADGSQVQTGVPSAAADTATIEQMVAGLAERAKPLIAFTTAGETPEAQSVAAEAQPQQIPVDGQQAEAFADAKAVLSESMGTASVRGAQAEAVVGVETVPSESAETVLPEVSREVIILAAAGETKAKQKVSFEKQLEPAEAPGAVKAFKEETGSIRPEVAAASKAQAANPDAGSDKPTLAADPPHVEGRPQVETPGVALETKGNPEGTRSVQTDVSGVLADRYTTEETQQRFDAARMVQRVIAATRAAREGAPMRMAVQLNPPHLGSLKVNILVQGATVVANMVAESEGARSLILAHSPQLSADLAEQGFELKGLDVSVSAGFDESLEQQASQQHPGSQRRRGASSDSFASVMGIEDIRKETFGSINPGEVRLVNVVA